MKKTYKSPNIKSIDLTSEAQVMITASNFGDGSKDPGGNFNNNVGGSGDGGDYTRQHSSIWDTWTD